MPFIDLNNNTQENTQNAQQPVGNNPQAQQTLAQPKSSEPTQQQGSQQRPQQFQAKPQQQPQQMTQQEATQPMQASPSPARANAQQAGSPQPQSAQQKNQVNQAQAQNNQPQIHKVQASSGQIQPGQANQSTKAAANQNQNQNQSQNQNQNQAQDNQLDQQNKVEVGVDENGVRTVKGPKLPDLPKPSQENSSQPQSDQQKNQDASEQTTKSSDQSGNLKAQPAGDLPSPGQAQKRPDQPESAAKQQSAPAPTDQQPQAGQDQAHQPEQAPQAQMPAHAGLQQNDLPPLPGQNQKANQTQNAPVKANPPVNTNIQPQQVQGSSPQPAVNLADNQQAQPSGQNTPSPAQPASNLSSSGLQNTAQATPADSSGDNQQVQQLAQQPVQSGQSQTQTQSQSPPQQAQPQQQSQTKQIQAKGTNLVGNTANLAQILQQALQMDASDVHFTGEFPIMLRIHGELVPISDPISTAHAHTLAQELLGDRAAEYEHEKEIDFSYTDEHTQTRFRVNLFTERGKSAGALRLISDEIRTLSELKLPDTLYKIIEEPYGLVLVVGPTGSGKSTTLAAMINHINQNRSEHIVTIEDPIEYIYPKGRSIVNQRELGADTMSWKRALKSVLREDPNVVLVGEMRDLDTIESTITVAETGHLTFATLHTNSAGQAIDRIIDVFPQGAKNQIRSQLANVLVAVISQRLVPVQSGGRRAALEIMLGTSAIKNAIRDNKTHQIDNIIQTSGDLGMVTIEKALVELVKEGELTASQAKRFSAKPDEIDSLLNSLS